MHKKPHVPIYNQLFYTFNTYKCKAFDKLINKK